ncbi:MAG: RHS repeat-associated core domain-containing protein [Microcoleus sp.]
MARFNYDSFGNLRNASGTGASLPGNAGGDFRFQGQWLDEATGLYNFRARYYDPETGRFMSYDPIELIEMEPESSNPYQFVYNNPHVYSDPTGMFSMAELNTADAMNNILSSMQTYGRQQTLEYFKQKTGEAVGQILFNALDSFIPTSNPYRRGIQAALDARERDTAGNMFEFFLTDTICELLEPIQSSINDIWLQPQVNRAGFAGDNGYHCPAKVGFDDIRKNWFRPDYIVRRGEPTNHKLKSWLVGDIKLSVKTVNDSYVGANGGSPRQPDQWSAITNHAKKQGYFITGFITLFDGGKQRQLYLQNLQKKAVESGVIALIVSIV